MIQEIRRACGIAAPPADAVVEEEETDEPAADVEAGDEPIDETIDELELELEKV